MSKVLFNKTTKVMIGLLAILLCNSYVLSCVQDESWNPGEFAIYVFKVGQGDGQQIVSPAGKTLLIDVAEMSWNSKKGESLVADKLRQAMGDNFSHIDCVVATHLHLDHIGYADKGGIWALVEKNHFTIWRLIDRDSAEWIDFDEGGGFDPPEELYWNNAGTVPSTAIHWLTYVLDPSNKSKLHREVAKKGDKIQINLGGDVVIEIVQYDGLDAKIADGATPVSGDHRGENYLPSENDYSITLKISYKELDYVSGGDTDGEYKISDFGYSYNDVESVIAPSIGEIEILHVNHQGSSHSSNQRYLDTLKPTISLISCGKNSYVHSDRGTLDRILSISKIYLTEKGDPGRDYKSSIVVDGHIVIKSTDGINFTANGDPFTIKQD